MSAPDLCRKHGIGDATFCNWRRKSKRPADTELRAKMKELASVRPRSGVGSAIVVYTSC